MSQQINLYNASFVPKRELLTAQSLAIASAVLLLLLAATASWVRFDAGARNAEMVAAQVAQKMAQERLEAVRQAAEGRKPSPALQAEIGAQKGLLAMRDEVLAALQDGMGIRDGGDSGSVGFAEYLRGLARQSVNGLWLTGFAVSAGGGDMSLRGRTLDKALLPDYVRRLNTEKAFAGKSFAGLRMDAKPDAAAPAGGVKTTAAVPPGPTFSPAAGSGHAYIEFQLAASAEEVKP